MQRRTVPVSYTHLDVYKRQVFSGGIPEALEDFSERHPEVKALLVPVEQFAETRRKMETAGTAEAILYHKIKSEL